MEPTLYKLVDETFVLHMKTGSNGSQQRLPTHFILLIDTSDSMSDCNKLENVKHSASLVLHFLGPQDRLSVVTFGDDAQTHANAVACTPEQKEALKAMFERIRTDGCTNLSAGLLAVRDILSRREVSLNALKTGILLLTDGHANRGVARADMLRDMVRQIHDEYPDVTLQAVGYGTEHNAELLKGVAEQTQGTYSIVDDKEGAATAIGDTLGSLFSCVAQRVAVVAGEKVVVEGSQFKVSDTSRIQIGDLYEDSETYLLFKPEVVSASAQPWGITIHGTLLPSMNTFQTLILLEEARTEVPPAVQSSITLTRIRYRVGAMFKELREFRYGTARFRGILERVAIEEATLQNSEFSENPVAKMLLAECASLRQAADVLQSGTHHDIQDVSTRLASHEAYTNLARGTTQSIHRRRAHSNVGSDSEDPAVPCLPRPGRVRFPDPTASVAASHSEYMTTPSANRVTRRVTQLMAAMSQGDTEASSTAAAEAAHP